MLQRSVVTTVTQQQMLDDQLAGLLLSTSAVLKALGRTEEAETMVSRSQRIAEQLDVPLDHPDELLVEPNPMGEEEEEEEEDDDEDESEEEDEEGGSEEEGHGAAAEGKR